MNSVTAVQSEAYQCLDTTVAPFAHTDKDENMRTAEEAWTTSTRLSQPFEEQHLHRSDEVCEQDAVSNFALSRIGETGASSHYFAIVVVLANVCTIFNSTIRRLAVETVISWLQMRSY